jgi:hypothetical protein
MKKMMPAIFILTLPLTVSNCRSTFQGWGSSLIEGVKSNGKIDSIGREAGRGIINGLTTGSSGRQLDSLLADLGSRLKHSTDSIISDIKDTVFALRDSIVDQFLIDHAAQLIDTLTGAKLKRNLGAVMDTLLGKSTKEKIDKLVASVINTALSNATRNKLIHLLDTLGGTANLKIGLIVDSAVSHIISGTEKIGGTAKTELNVLQKEAVPIVVASTAIIIALAVLAMYFFKRKNMYSRISEILAFQIHSTKSDHVFKDIRDRVSAQAKDENLESALRGLLKKKGILGIQTRESVPERTV